MLTLTSVRFALPVWQSFLQHPSLSIFQECSKTLAYIVVLPHLKIKTIARIVDEDRVHKICLVKV